MQNTTIIIGLGNEYLSDDGVGVHIARGLEDKIRENSSLSATTRVERLSVGGLALLDYVIGYHTCFIIDAVTTGLYPPGTLLRHRECCDEETLTVHSSHHIALSQLFGIAKLLELDVPSMTAIYGIEPFDLLTFSTRCTRSVEDAIPRCIAVIYDDLVGLQHPTRENVRHSPVNSTVSHGVRWQVMKQSVWN